MNCKVITRIIVLVVTLLILKLRINDTMKLINIHNIEDKERNETLD